MGPESFEFSRSLESWRGGKNWPPIAFNPNTRMIYIPANENLCGTMIGRTIAYTPGRSYTGATSDLYFFPGSDHIGEVQAWNVDTGKRVWTHPFAKSVPEGGAAWVFAVK